MARRAANSLTLMIADIDRFKRVNDLCGHQEGDRVLREVAHALGAAFRSADFVCRYGGEEFGVILPNTNEDNALALAEKARQSISGVRWMPPNAKAPESITVTIGVAVFPADATSVEELVRLADVRLYEGKNAGRNRVVGRPSGMTPSGQTA